MSDTYKRSSVLQIAFEELERARFLKDSEGNIAQRVSLSGDTGILEGVKYDSVLASYPSQSTELYTYSLNSVTQAQVLVTYADIDKEIFISAVKL